LCAERERLFMHCCFPEMDRAGLLGSSERTGIKYSREVWAAVCACVAIVVVIIVVIDVELIMD
jgi:hypothetical protein